MVEIRLLKMHAACVYVGGVCVCIFQSVLQLLLFVGRLPRGQMSPAPSCLSDCENVYLFFFIYIFRALLRPLVSPVFVL